MEFKFDENNKWDVYSCCAEGLCREYSLEQLSGWLSDLAAELSQWSLRQSHTHGTLYKKKDLLTYIQYMTKCTVLLMAVHHKICEDNKELYEIIEKGVVHEFYEEYCEE